MGKKFGKMMKAVAAAVDALSQEQIAELEANGRIYLGTLENIDNLEILVEDVEIISEDIPGWLVSNEGSLTVALEVELTEELKQEGMAREIINRVQNLRKDSGLEITDRIHIIIAPHAEIQKAVEGFGDYIRTQVLADDITIAPNEGMEVEFDDFNLNIQITKS